MPDTQASIRGKIQRMRRRFGFGIPLAGPLVALAFCPLASAQAPGTFEIVPKTPRSLEEVARQIQIICFAAYPDDLVQRMSGRPAPVPEEVRSDPRLQIEYLKSEEVVRKGLFYPTLLDELLPAVRAAVRPEARFLDLGSGDGRVVFLASPLGARAFGIEFDRGLHRIALAARGRLSGLIDVDRAVLKRGDFLKEDFAGYDVFFYFGSGSSAEDRLLTKLRREMGRGAILLLAHPQGPVPGFVEVTENGVVRIVRPRD